MALSSVTDAFDAEAAALCHVARGLDDADLDRASPCPPWTVAELLCHIVVATGRVRQALAEPGDELGEIVDSTSYYRPDERFSAAANADRIETATELARRLGSAAAISAELARIVADASALLRAASPRRTVRTRHGDRMLLPDFGRTRVVELAVHGLDLAAGLGREPWLTRQAGDLLEGFMLAGADAATVRAEMGHDRAGLLAVLTGRVAMSGRDDEVLRRHGVKLLALG